MSLEVRVPKDHPLRDYRRALDRVSARLMGRLSRMYSAIGRPSIPPEQLRALVLQMLYTTRSERLLMEQIDYNLVRRSFVGLLIDDPAGVPTVCTKSRDRLLNGDVAKAFLAAVVEEARRLDLLDDEHFAVGGDAESSARKAPTLRAPVYDIVRIGTLGQAGVCALNGARPASTGRGGAQGAAVAREPSHEGIVSSPVPH